MAYEVSYSEAQVGRVYVGLIGSSKGPRVLLSIWFYADAYGAVVSLFSFSDGTTVGVDNTSTLWDVPILLDVTEG